MFNTIFTHNTEVLFMLWKKRNCEWVTGLPLHASSKQSFRCQQGQLVYCKSFRHWSRTCGSQQWAERMQICTLVANSADNFWQGQTKSTNEPNSCNGAVWISGLKIHWKHWKICCLLLKVRITASLLYLLLTFLDCIMSAPKWLINILLFFLRLLWKLLYMLRLAFLSAQRPAP